MRQCVIGSVGLSVSRLVISPQSASQSVIQSLFPCLSVCLSVCLSTCPSICLSLHLSVKLKISQLPVTKRRDRYEILCMMSILTIIVFSFTSSSRFYSQLYSSIAICCSELFNCDEENSFITKKYWSDNLCQSALRKPLQRHRYSCKYAKRVLWVKFLTRTGIALLHNFSQGW